jgi:nucleotide-binding universal stress UspA family protein
MGKILCATRGGEASYRAQDAAIALAKRQGDTLIFLYVVDIHFLDKMAAPIVVNVEHGLAKMGEFLLLMAQERAAAQGIEAQALVRRGRLRAELVAAARELGADLILLGRPLDEQAVFDDVALRALATALEAVTGAEVQIV